MPIISLGTTYEVRHLIAFIAGAFIAFIGAGAFIAFSDNTERAIKNGALQTKSYLRVKGLQ